MVRGFFISVNIDIVCLIINQSHRGDQLTESVAKR